MPLLLVKLVVTPLIILAATLAARRWGDAVGGWLVGLPVISGPVSLFLAIEQGPDFAAEAASGSLSGVVSQAAFCLGYVALAAHGWPAGFLGGALAYLVAAGALLALHPPHDALFGSAVAALTLVLWSVPRAQARNLGGATPRWDLPARMAVTTALVVGLTTFASLLGPRAAGVIASFPLLAASLAAFAQTFEGPAAGIAVMRGMAGALYGFATFFLLIGHALPRLGVAAAFLAASASALLIQGATLWLIRPRAVRAAA